MTKEQCLRDFLFDISYGALGIAEKNEIYQNREIVVKKKPKRNEQWTKIFVSGGFS